MGHEVDTLHVKNMIQLNLLCINYSFGILKNIHTISFKTYELEG